MDRNGPKIIIALAALIFLTTSLTAQTQKRVAPVKKKKAEVTKSDKDSDSGKKELNLDTIRIEKERQEKIGAKDKKLSTVSRSSFVTPNPQAEDNGLKVWPVLSTLPQVPIYIFQDKNMLSIYGGSFETFGVDALLNKGEWWGSSLDVSYRGTSGHIENAGENAFGFDMAVSAIDNLPLQLFLNSSFKTNITKSTESEIKDQTILRFGGKYLWDFNDIHNTATIYDHWEKLGIPDSATNRSDNLLGVRNAFIYDDVDNFNILADLYFGYHSIGIDGFTLNNGSFQWFLSLNAKINLSDDMFVQAGLKAFDIPWNRFSGSQISKEVEDGILPDIGMGLSSRAGIFSIAYSPGVDWGFFSGDIYQFPNILKNGSGFNATTATQRIVGDYQYQDDRLKISAHLGWEKLNKIPILLASDSLLSTWDYSADADRIFAVVELNWIKENNYQIFSDFKYQLFSNIIDLSHLPFKPTFTWDLRFTKFFLRQWSGAAGFIYYSQQYILPDQDDQTDSQLNAIFQVGYKPIEPIKIEIKLENIFGQKIQVAPNYRLPDFYFEITASYSF